MLAPIGSHVNENEKNNRKNLVIENFETRKICSGDMVGRELPQNLAWIHAAVSEKPEFMDDACARTVALPTKLSRAKKERCNFRL